VGAMLHEAIMAVCSAREISDRSPAPRGGSGSSPSSTIPSPNGLRRRPRLRGWGNTFVPDGIGYGVVDLCASLWSRREPPARCLSWLHDRPTRVRPP
jgi:hypothetical protein